MAEFGPSYYSADSLYNDRFATADKANERLKEPIIPVNQLGITVPENDPAGRVRNMVEGIQGAIRSGAGSVQLMFMTHQQAAIGGRPKAYGTEVRQAIREIVKVNEINFAGVELPTSMNNLAGFNAEAGVYSEEQRQNDLNEVKDAIRFAADVGGGGVDIVSWEYERSISDADWNKEGKWKGAFETPGKVEAMAVVDTRTGRVSRFKRDENIYTTRNPHDPQFKETQEIWKEGDIDENNKKISEDMIGLPKLYKWTWDDFKNYTKYRKSEAEKKGETLDEHPETIYMQEQIDQKIKIAKGYADHYMKELRQEEYELEEFHQAKEAGVKEVRIRGRGAPMPVDDGIKTLQREVDRARQLIIGQLQEAKNLEEAKETQKPVSEYAFEKSMDSYSDAGIAAMQETDRAENDPTKKLVKPIYVGPEIGWPHAYDSHPTEFVNTIKKAREKMVEKLTDREGEYKMSEKEAEKKAEQHIKGVFDTGHMGMWLQHFKPHLPWEQRKKEFEKWYLDQIDQLAEENRKHHILGGIQAVDSASAAHGHLPPGQGILPVVKATKKLKDAGFDGFIVSEGHEEEKFGAGRIMLKTWEAFGAPISSGYGPAVRGTPTWGGVSNYSLGRTYSPTVVIGGYAPSQDFRVWSEVLLE